MRARIAFAVVLCTALAISGFIAFAQQAPATFPVIVVMNDGASFQSYADRYQRDERAVFDPDAWDYQDRGVLGAVQDLEQRHGFRSERAFSAAIRGFAGRLTARQIADLENDPWVSYVELDGTMSISQRPAPPPSPGPRPGGGGAQVLPWGINRVDADLSSTLAGNGSGAVANVRAYIIDTGIQTTHSDLNVVAHVNFAGGTNADCHGHGTHVAGTVAARDNTIDVVGVAPGAPLTGVKVLGCNGSGSTSGVIAGVDWVTANAAGKVAVANMSLGGSPSTALDNAVKSSAASGVFYSIAAGNSGTNACNQSPARAGAGDNGIVTTAATDSANKEASFSNYGACVDIWAPGVGVLSTKLGGGTTTFSGTSMAAPHVGGGGALYLSLSPAAGPVAVEVILKSFAVSTGTQSKNGAAVKLLNVAAF
jgi:subtilisin family serine protease